MIASTSRSGKHDSLVLKHQIIPMLPSPDAFAFFLLPIECRYSHRILCEPFDLFVGYYPTNLTCLIPCVNWIRRVKYHPLPSMIFFIVDNLPRLCANTTWSCMLCSAFLGKAIHLILVYHH